MYIKDPSKIKKISPLISFEGDVFEKKLANNYDVGRGSYDGSEK